MTQLWISEGLLHRLQSATEQVGVELLEAGSRDRRVEVDAFVQWVELNARLRAACQRAFCTFARRPQTSHGALVVA